MIGMFLIGLFCGAAALLVAVRSPRVRGLLLKSEPRTKLLPSESEFMREWKRTFREVVVATDGAVAPEMEEFLRGDGERVDAFLAGARAQAEKMRAEVLAAAERECAEMRAEAEREVAKAAGWVRNKRPLLIGPARRSFDVDRASCKSAEERGAVSVRWHNKGFLFPLELRERLLQAAVDETSRDRFRMMFDEQDKPDPSTTTSKRTPE